MNFTALLTIIATLFLLMACGFFARKKGIIDDVASKRLSTLIIKIGQPMMIISALTEAEFSYENLGDGFLYIGIGIIFHAVMGGLAFILCKGFKDLDERKITEFSLMFVNGGFIGFPILEALFGAKGLLLAAFFNISFHLFIWSWGVAILARKRSDIKLTVRKIFINLGINESWSTSKKIANGFSQLIEIIREYQPDAKIIIQGIMTVTEKYASKNSCFEPDNLNAHNAKLAELANGTDVFFIDVNVYFTNKDGYLYSDLTGDGCHLKAKHYASWAAWISYAVGQLGL